MRRSLPVRRDVRDFLEGASVGPQRWIPCSSARAVCAVGAHAGCAWTAQAALRPLKLAVHGLPGLRSGYAQAALARWLCMGCSGSAQAALRLLRLDAHAVGCASAALRLRLGCCGWERISRAFLRCSSFVRSGCADLVHVGCSASGCRGILYTAHNCASKIQRKKIRFRAYSY